MRRTIAITLVFLSVGTASAFEVPERFSYGIYWSGMKAGDSLLETDHVLGGRIRIAMTAESTRFVSVFYPVDFRVESVLEPGSPPLPAFASTKSTMGKKRKDNNVYFDRTKGKALFKDIVKGREDEYDIKGVLYDTLSAMFAVRDMELFEGKSVHVEVFDGDIGPYNMEVRVLGRERVGTPFGEFDTVVLRPMLESESIFSKDSPVYTWFTDDHRRLPVRIKAKVSIGSVDVLLTGYERGALAGQR